MNLIKPLGIISADQPGVRIKECMRSFWRLSSICLVTVMVINLVACKKDSKEQSPAVLLVQPPAETGGDGSGGGNFTTTDPKVIERHIENLKSNLKTIVTRVRAWEDDPGSFIIDRPFNDFFNDPRLIDTINNMNVRIQTAPCNPPRSEEKAAYADTKTQTVCFSVNELSKLPEESYSLEIDALGIHEVAHLLGHDEYLSSRIQKWLVNHPWIVDLKNTHLLPMLNAYDSAIAVLEKVIYFAAYRERPSLCRYVSQWETRLTVLESTLDELPGSIWRVRMVPRDLFPDRGADQMLPILNWGNDACDDKPLLKEERLAQVNNAVNAAKHMADKRAKLAKYISENDPYANFPTLVGFDEITGAPVIIEALKRDIRIPVIELNEVKCQVANLATKEIIELKPGTTAERGDFLGAEVRDQKGQARPIEFRLSDIHVALIQTSFKESDLHIISVPKDAYIVTYFTSLFGMYHPFAALEHFRTLEVEFYITEKGSDFNAKPTGDTYKLTCRVR